MVELFIENQFQGAYISTYKIRQPDYSFKLKDIGSCAWEVALSDEDFFSGDPIAADEFAPKRTDYILKASSNHGVNMTGIQGGRLLDVDLESDTGVIRCAGKDWLEYLDQPFPFDYSLTVSTLTDASNMVRAFLKTAGTDTTTVKYNATQQKIVTQILIAASGLSDIDYTGSFTGTGWTEVLQYTIDYLDDTTMLDHIRAISDLNDPFGFDYWCGWDKQVNLYAPRYIVNPNSVTTIVDLVYGDDAVVGVKWHNGGPKATRTVAHNGVGIWKQSIYQPSIDQFRDFLELVSLGEHFNQGASLADIQGIINVAADAIGTKDRNPQKDLTLTVLPSLLLSPEIEGYKPLIGKAISYDSGDEFDPYHRINAEYWIVSQDYRTEDDSGNYVLDLGLQQIYPL